MARPVNNQELSRTEQEQYGFFVRAIPYDVQESFWVHEENRLDEGYRMTREYVFKAYVQQPFAREIYR